MRTRRTGRHDLHEDLREDLHEDLCEDLREDGSGAHEDGNLPVRRAAQAKTAHADPWPRMDRPVPDLTSWLGPARKHASHEAASGQL